MIGPRHIVIGTSFLQLEETPLVATAKDDETAINAIAAKFAGFQVKPLDVLPDRKLWFIEVSNSRNPGTFLLCDPASGGLALIGTACGSRLPEASLAAGDRVRFTGRHGHPLTGMLWRVPGKRPAPLVIFLPRALPFLPATDTYDPDVQALIASGFSVAKINVRGSYGFGRAFAAAAEKEFAVCVREDLEDAVCYLATQPGIDANRVALVGEHFGGVLAVACVAASNRFSAAVNINAPVEFGVNGLQAFTTEEDTTRLSDQLGGWKQASRLAKELSPLETAPRCRVPVLHLYNTSDERGQSICPEGESLQRAVKRTGAPGRFAGAYPSFYQARTLTQVSSDHAAIMARIVAFLREKL